MASLSWHDSGRPLSTLRVYRRKALCLLRVHKWSYDEARSCTVCSRCGIPRT